MRHVSHLVRHATQDSICHFTFRFVSTSLHLFQITCMCSECLDNQLQMSFNETGNQCCDTCQPGYGVIVNCTAAEQTVCESCIPGKTYSSPKNTLNACMGCSSCGNTTHFVLHPCNVTHDTLCQCPKGSYYDPGTDECKFCDPCPPGMGASRMCTSKHNSMCSECESNVTFSSKLDPFSNCQPCTVCSDTEVTLQACSIREDTICFSKYMSRYTCGSSQMYKLVCAQSDQSLRWALYG